MRERGRPARSGGTIYNLSFQPGLREQLDAFIARENERLAPARMTMAIVINEAIREYIERRGAGVELERERVSA